MLDKNGKSVEIGDWIVYTHEYFNNKPRITRVNDVGPASVQSISVEDNVILRSDQIELADEFNCVPTIKNGKVELLVR